MDSPKFQWSKMTPDRNEQIVVRGDEYKQWVLDIEAAKQQLPKEPMKPIEKQMEEFIGGTSAEPTVPICGVHGTPMVWKTGQYKQTTQWHKAGEDYAFWSCSKKNANGSYCNFKPKK